MKIFINLTAGLEFAGHFDGFVRIQSTLLEQTNYSKIIEELDYNFLVTVISGVETRVIDFSSRKPVGRVVFQGIPWINFCLHKTLNRQYIPYILKENHKLNVLPYFEEMYDKLSEAAKRKLKYVCKFNTGQEINLSGATYRAYHDNGVLDFYQEAIRKFGRVV